MAPMRRPCVWRVLPLPANEAMETARRAEGLAAGVREAGALALSMFGTPLKQWTKGASSPVSEADIAVDRLLHERLTRDRPCDCLVVGRERRRSCTAHGTPGLDRRSDRRHARLYRGHARLDRIGGARGERTADCGLPLRPGDRRVLHGVGRARAPPAMVTRSARPPARTLPTSESRGRRIFSSACPRSLQPLL